MIDYTTAMEQANQLVEDERNGISFWNGQRALFGKFILDRSMNECIDITNGKIVSENAISREGAQYKRSIKPTEVKFHLPGYAGTCFFVPGTDPAYETECKGKFNTCEINKIQKPSSNPVLHPEIDEIINSISGDDSVQKEYIFAWVAYKYRNPTKSNIPSLFFVAEQSTGKGFFVEGILQYIFSEEYFLKINGITPFSERFQPMTNRSLITFVDEVNTFGMKDARVAGDAMKNEICNKKCVREVKGGDFINYKNITSFVMATNHRKTIHLDPDSDNRRFAVIEGRWRKLDQKTIDEFVYTMEYRKERFNDFLAYCLDHIPEGTSIAAPDTPLKREMMQGSKTVPEEYADWLETRFDGANFFPMKYYKELKRLFEYEMGGNTLEKLNDKIFRNDAAKKIDFNVPRRIDGKSIKGMKLKSARDIVVLMDHQWNNAILGGNFVPLGNESFTKYD